VLTKPQGQQAIWHLREHARAIARLGVGIHRAAMREIRQRLQRVLDHGMRSAPRDIDDNTCATAIVLELGIVERVVRWSLVVVRRMDGRAADSISRFRVKRSIVLERVPGNWLIHCNLLERANPRGTAGTRSAYRILAGRSTLDFPAVRNTKSPSHAKTPRRSRERGCNAPKTRHDSREQTVLETGYVFATHLR
jgi:hypothetical protein